MLAGLVLAEFAPVTKTIRAEARRLRSSLSNHGCRPVCARRLIERGLPHVPNSPMRAFSPGTRQCGWSWILRGVPNPARSPSPGKTLLECLGLTLQGSRLIFKTPSMSGVGQIQTSRCTIADGRSSSNSGKTGHQRAPSSRASCTAA